MSAPAAESRPASTSPRAPVGRPVRGTLNRVAIVAPVLALALLLSIIVAVTVGPADIGVGEVWATVAHHLGVGEGTPSALRDGIIWQLRMPRVLTAALVGGGLAVSGAVMQGLTRNPLADPYLLGLSSGASLGAVAVLLLGVSLLLPFAAFVGALLALMLTVLLAGAGGRLTPTRMVLAGLAVSSLAASVTSFVIFWTATGDSYREILSWLMGSLSGAGWSSAVIAAVGFAVAGLPLLFTGRLLDTFAFGDTAAASLGVNVQAARLGLLAGTALLTGAMVSVSGAIGFVGLILPHAVRLLVGPGYRALLPLVALVGAIFLIWADTLARTLLDPREIPVGIVTALIGAPVFALLLVRNRRIS